MDASSAVSADARKRSRVDEEEGDAESLGAGEEQNQELVALIEQRAELTSGTFPALQQRKQQLELARRDRIAKAEQDFKWAVESAQRMLDYHRQEADDIFRTSFETVRTTMLVALDDEIRRTREARQDAGEVRQSSRRLRSRTRGEVEKARPKPNGLVPGAPLLNMLTEHESLNDLQLIHEDWVAQARRFAKQRELVVEAAHGSIVVAGVPFVVGDVVIVASEVTGEQVYGSVLSITPTEVLLRHPDETKSRVYVEHLRTQRCTMRQEGSVAMHHQMQAGPHTAPHVPPAATHPTTAHAGGPRRRR